MAMDAAEFRELIAEHQRLVYSIALRITRDPGVAEEVAQDVFLELHRSVERLEGEDHLRFWLRRVAVHRATDALRKGSRRPESGAESWIDELHGADRSGGLPLDRGMAHRLETAVGSLPEAMRVAVVLRYSEELTPDEISRLLGQPLATVKSNLQRGLKILRQNTAITLKEYVR